MNDIGNVLDAATGLQAPSEGFSAWPYLDRLANPPVWTIGEGSTRDPSGNPVTVNTSPIDRATARLWARAELLAALVLVRRAVAVPLTIGEEAALVDLAFNVGPGAVSGSTLLRLLNAGDVLGAAAQFEVWDHAGGRAIAGLLRRRRADEAEFLQPDFNPAAADQAVAQGELI